MSMKTAYLMLLFFLSLPLIIFFWAAHRRDNALKNFLHEQEAESIYSIDINTTDKLFHTSVTDEFSKRKFLESISNAKPVIFTRKIAYDFNVSFRYAGLENSHSKRQILIGKNYLFLCRTEGSDDGFQLWTTDTGVYSFLEENMMKMKAEGNAAKGDTSNINSGHN